MCLCVKSTGRTVCIIFLLPLIGLRQYNECAGSRYNHNAVARVLLKSAMSVFFLFIVWIRNVYIIGNAQLTSSLTSAECAGSLGVRGKSLVIDCGCHRIRKDMLSKHHGEHSPAFLKLFWTSHFLINSWYNYSKQMGPWWAQSFYIANLQVFSKWTHQFFFCFFLNHTPPLFNRPVIKFRAFETL